MRVLVIGASGMIGSAMFRVLRERGDMQVMGSLRSDLAMRFFTPAQRHDLIAGIDVLSHDALTRVFAQVRPEVVVNCVGLTKHHRASDDPRLSLPLNAMLPHRLADLCAVAGARLVHVSTDCVFSGARGRYAESDPADAMDVYGRTKVLGEVDYPHAITLRTSTIGHELCTRYGLLEWFLAQKGRCRGFRHAVFSGLPSTVFARVVRDVVIPYPSLRGLYHVGAGAIDKFALLELIAKVYQKQIDIVMDEQFVIDRSLDTSRFSEATAYVAPQWPELIQTMHADQVSAQ